MNIKEYVIRRIVSNDGSVINKVFSNNTIDDFVVVTFDWDNFKRLENFYNEEEPKSGVYILKARIKGSNGARMYIGETNNLIKRLGQHKKVKESSWVEKACFFYRDSESQIQLRNELEYLEKSFISLVVHDNLNESDNKTAGKKSSRLGKEKKMMLNDSIESIIHKLNILDWKEFKKP